MTNVVFEDEKVVVSLIMASVSDSGKNCIILQNVKEVEEEACLIPTATAERSRARRKILFTL